MSDTVKCASCEKPVDVWGYGKSLLFWFMLSGCLIFVGALTMPLGIGFVILPVGVLALLGMPVGAAVTKGMRRCGGCKSMWPAKKDGAKAL